MAERPNWKRRFEEPIVLPDGRKLVTLLDAANYITALPKKEADIAEWQAAIQVLMLVANSGTGPTMMARTGIMQALNRNVPCVFSERKSKQRWTKVKLLRDR